MGGVATIVHYLAAYHSAHGHQVDLLPMRQKPFRLDPIRKFESLGCRVFTSSSDHRYSPWQLRRLLKLMGDYDIIHVHQFPTQHWGALASLMRHRKGSPKIITTEHTTYTNRRRHSALRYYDRWMYSHYDHIACISNATRDALTQWLGKGFLEDRISVITNGIDFDRFHNAAATTPSGFIPDPDVKYICWVGRMEEPKTPITLLKALTKLPDECHALFLGDGYLMKECKQYISDHKLGSRVHLLGNIDDVSGVLKCAQVGVLTTDYDGFGLAAAECMASGFPVVASDVAGLNQVIGREDLVFTHPDEAQLAEKLHRLLYDHDYYLQAAKWCNEYVRQFSAEKMAREYMELYTRLLN